MLKRTLAAALAAITAVYTTVPAEAHGRHFHRHHGHHGFYGSGGHFGFGFGSGFGYRGYGHRRHYAPRGFDRYRRIPAAAVHQSVPESVPAAPIESSPAPVTVAPAYVPQQQTYTPAPVVESAPVAPLQQAPVPVTTVAPSNRSYESIGSYDAYSSQFQTTPAPIQSLPTQAFAAPPAQTFAAPTFTPEVLEVVPADTFTTAPSFSAPQPLQLESIQTVPIFQ